ncbi:Replication termination factor 2 [Malassezia yamatoensis]|uniref:Replication termination factor 2 n=1 Tax=Malassezia yamatoensis TaxID=253288 RepID=A0AAJ5YXE5_9BASI|nr:Replication termination factor 2 [Malassezia yamatoensis]
MIDRLGQMYNKEGVIEYLLRRAKQETQPKEDQIAKHIKGLKDVREVRLLPNPVRNDSDKDYYAYLCPLTQRALNGKYRVVCLWTCGCVMSESGLRETTGVSKSSSETRLPCPVCNELFDATPILDQSMRTIDQDIVWVNPPAEEQLKLREHLASAQKANKRKKAESGSLSEKRSKMRAPTLNEAAPGAYAANQVRIAQANAAMNSPSVQESEAVASLYRKTPSKRDVWLGKQAS